MLDNVEWTSDEWKAWLQAQVTLRQEIYIKSPADMTSAYQREKGHRDDYHGRELLELLQNADDAAEGVTGSSRVLFDLTEHGLCVANTGITFSADGVVSLMISDHSPKIHHRSSYIGNKGLGFRAILNWTDAPAILSGNLALNFNRQGAQDWLRNLCADNPAVQREVDKFRQEGEWPIAVLNVPGWLEQPDPAREGTDAATVATMDTAQKLRRQGYDTVIAIPFSAPEIRAEVEEQLEAFAPDLLLFANHLQSLVIRHSETSVEWHVERLQSGQGHEVTVTGSSLSAPQKWRIFERNNYLPEECLTGDQKTTVGFEIKLAIPEKEVAAPGFLYSYFPTNARFPYPVLAHATLDLSNNRQQIRRSAANQHIVNELARFLVRTATDYFTTPDDPWRALSLIIPDASGLDPDLERLHFQETLLTAARGCAIVPTRDGTFRTAATAPRLHPGGSDYLVNRSVEAGDWLPLEQFNDLVLPLSSPRIKPAQLHQILHDLQGALLSETDLRARLNAVSPALSLQDRSRLIAGLARHNLTPSDPSPTLLVGEDASLIEPQYRVFLPPTEGIEFSLPLWMKVRILSNTLAEELRQEFAASGRELTAQLRPYGVSEYAFAALALGLQAQANEKVREDLGGAARYRDETLQAVYALYGRADKTTVPPSRPEDLRLPLRTCAGGVGAAPTLCFSGGYSCGALTEALYREVSPDLLVVDPASLGLEGGSDEITRFLRWLGVSDRPHVNRSKQPTPEYQQYVQSKLHLPVELDAWPGSIVTLDDNEIKEQRVENVATIPFLSRILRIADPHAIIAWIALDQQRFDTWRSEGDPGARYYLLLRGKRNDRVVRNQVLPSYVSWLLRQVAWMPTAQGRRRPAECLLAPNLPESVRNLLPRPQIEIAHLLFTKLGLDAVSVHNALTRAGIRTSLDELSWEEVYKLLTRLPESDPEGDYARHLYRALLQRTDLEAPSDEEREQFRREGKLWGRHGNAAGYFPVVSLYHHDSGALPDLITGVVPLVEIGRGEGARKVERLFGVSPLNRDHVEVTVNKYEAAGDTDAFQKEIDRLKPFIYALRRSADAQGTGKRRLRDLRLLPCRHVEGTVRFKQNRNDFRLEEPGATLLVEGDDVAYILSEAVPDLRDSLLSDGVASIFAELMEVEGRGPFAQLAACPHSHRPLLLKRMIGSDAEALLAEARKELQSPDDTSDPWYIPPPFPSAPSETPTEPSTDHMDETKDKGAKDTEAPPPGPVGAVHAVAGEHQVLSPPRRVERRTQTKRAKAVMQRPQRLPASGDRSEEAVFEFEKAGGQDRFPLRIGHVTGRKGFGCDVLSFVTAAAREEYQTSGNPGLVERFIEVKGRSHPTGTIGLEGNEWENAEKFGERYYLYRVYEGDKAGEFDLLILKNPAAAGNNTLLHIIDPFRETTTERWSITEQFIEVPVEVTNDLSEVA